jgi:hypothetical protein
MGRVTWVRVRVCHHLVSFKLLVILVVQDDRICSFVHLTQRLSMLLWLL